ncbi:MAG: MFS transporter [Methylocystaceae bacterium]
MAKSTNELVRRLDDSQLTGNHVKVVTAAVLGDLLEFFDNNIIGFVLAFIIIPWGLSYGQTAYILLSSGVGSIIGAFLFGRWADKIGRRPIFITTIIFFSLATGAQFFTPDGAWGYLTVFRFLTGVGIGGLYCVDLPLVQEFVPSKYRGRASGIVTSFIPIGTMIASSTAAFLTPSIGWRGLFLIGLIPAALTLLIRAWVPESPRWLIRNGKYDQASAAVEWVTGNHDSFDHAKHEKSEWINDLPEAPKAKFTEIFKYPRSVWTTWLANIFQQMAYICFSMWGAMLIALVTGCKPEQAAKLFIWVTLGGFVGRWFWAFMADKIGRRLSGMILGSAAAILLVIATTTTKTMVGETSLFWLFMIAIYFFADGGYALVGPYGSEVWPARLRATGMGSAYGMGGIGKIIGPMIIAIFAGSTNIIKPAATADAITPTYIFLAVCFAIMAVVFFFARETNGKTVEQIEAELEAESRA